MTQSGLAFVNELLVEGFSVFTFENALTKLGRQPSATANFLSRLEKAGLIERVRRGYYAIRPLGMLGTPSIIEDIALGVGAAFKDVPHRIAYRTALYEHDLLTHPVRSIHVASTHTVRTKTLCGWPLKMIIEPLENLEVGKIPWGLSQISDVHRTILDAAHRPSLVGGAEILAEALTVAAPILRADKLLDYAHRLDRSAAIRRLGSLADALTLEPLQNALTPLRTISADLDLVPGQNGRAVWRDKRWHVRWPRSIDEILAVINQ